MLDFEKILTEYKVDYKAPNNRGWLAVQCPFCGDVGWHGAFNIRTGLFTCWKCGVKSTVNALSKTLDVPASEVEKLTKDFKTFLPETDEIKINRPKEVFLPKSATALKGQHKKYLRNRNFDYEYLEKVWGLKGTGENDKEYANRIIIPIYHNNKLVSFHSRDITGKSKIKAKACPLDKEVIPHKDLVYGFDKVPGNTVIVTEGPFDKWRFGDQAVCTFGIKFNDKQVEMLSCFANIFILFDSILNEDGDETENQAQTQAERLADLLSIRNNVWVINEFKSDPGDMSQRQAERILALIKDTIKQ